MQSPGPGRVSKCCSVTQWALPNRNSMETAPMLSLPSMSPHSLEGWQGICFLLELKSQIEEMWIHKITCWEIYSFTSFMLHIAGALPCENCFLFLGKDSCTLSAVKLAPALWDTYLLPKQNHLDLSCTGASTAFPHFLGILTGASWMMPEGCREGGECWQMFVGWLDDGRP